MPAAAPAASSVRRSIAVIATPCPTSDPTAPPVAMIGPSAPNGPPVPMAIAADSGLSQATRAGIRLWLRTICSIASGMPWPRMALDPNRAMTPTISPPSTGRNHDQDAEVIQRRRRGGRRQAAVEREVRHQRDQVASGLRRSRRRARRPRSPARRAAGRGDRAAAPDAASAPRPAGSSATAPPAPRHPARPRALLPAGRHRHLHWLPLILIVAH